ncbi:MAG: molybdopterin-synthase adenylyltransferase MoeB [Oleispira sp.]|nr:molybdopterin-synthase adenylyltransferase MoeB [Oleispira sp.]
MNDNDLLRYSRHIFLPEMDIEGQQKLLDSRVLIIGLGGLGSPALQYLAASGIGHLTLVDHDVVELSNVQRQICHGTEDVGKTKVQSAIEEVRRINSTICVEGFEQKADAPLLQKLLPTIDLVVDCSDNFDIRYLINDVCIQHKTPWVSGAAVALQGQVICFDPRLDDQPCYRCLYPQAGDEQRNCATSGILAPVVGIIGTLQALEVIKIITGIGKPVLGRLQTFDALEGQWRSWGLNKDPDCLSCLSR